MTTQLFVRRSRPAACLVGPGPTTSSADRFDAVVVSDLGELSVAVSGGGTTGGEPAA